MNHYGFTALICFIIMIALMIYTSRFFKKEYLGTRMELARTLRNNEPLPKSLKKSLYDYYNKKAVFLRCFCFSLIEAGFMIIIGTIFVLNFLMNVMIKGDEMYERQRYTIRELLMYENKNEIFLILLIVLLGSVLIPIVFSFFSIKSKTKEMDPSGVLESNGI